MNIYERDLLKLQERGVYALVNTKNNKVYIGSTSKSFKERFSEHQQRLNAGNHENKYLQRSWNKYKNYFIFRVLLICEDNLFWEQRAFDLYHPFKERGYNINRNAAMPPSIVSKEVFKKRASTFKKTINAAFEYYKKLISGEIGVEEIPQKYLKLVNYYAVKTPWNKGKTGYTNPNYPKNRELSEEGLLKRKEAFKKFRKLVYVYKDGELLGVYNGISDIIEDVSLKEYVSLFRSKRGKDLKAPNIANSCRTNKPYKGLLFSYGPL